MDAALVRVTCDSGETGIGEITHGQFCYEPVVGLIEHFRRLLVGRPAREINRAWELAVVRSGARSRISQRVRARRRAPGISPYSRNQASSSRWEARASSSAAVAPRRLRLRVPTVVHHLHASRLAGLVHIPLEVGGGRRYAARPEALSGTWKSLQSFVGGVEEKPVEAVQTPTLQTANWDDYPV